MNLVHMGILHGKGKVLFRPCKFKIHVHLLSDAQILTLHKAIVTHLSAMPYGPFHATTIILGIEEAKTQARREELMLPACFIHEVAQISQPVEEPQPPK